MYIFSAETFPALSCTERRQTGRVLPVALRTFLNRGFCLLQSLPSASLPLRARQP
jgi:hypothetical protein